MTHIAHLRGDWCPEAGALSGGTRFEVVCRTCGAWIAHRVREDESLVAPISEYSYRTPAPVRRNTAKRDERLAIGIVAAVLLALVCLASSVLGYLIVVPGFYGLVGWAVWGYIQDK